MDFQKEITELKIELAKLRQENHVLREENKQLKKEIQELKARLTKNSRNSSKPPSSDGFKKEPKPNPKSLRQNSNRKSGGQVGHNGHKLCRRENPDEIFIHTVDSCANCGQDLTDVEISEVQKKQVFDIPPLTIHVTEHQAEIKKCACCGEITIGKFSEGLVQEAQYGPRVKAFLTYMNQYHFLPYDRSEQLMRDVFNQNISEGTIKNILEKCYCNLEATEEKLKDSLKNAGILHSDETGMRTMGNLYWQHVVSTKSLTYYGIHKKRGNEAIDTIGILPEYKGTLVHDHFSAYFKHGDKHVLCNAHHLRELTFIEESYNQSWAKHMKGLLLAIKKQRNIYKQSDKREFTAMRLATYERCYDKIIMLGYWHPDNIKLPENKDGKKPSRKQTKAKNLLDRLRFHKQEMLAFMYNFDLPFDNNLAERDLRMSKVKQKISGCFRSEAGARYFCRIRSYISTARKNGVQILDALEKVFLGKPFIPNLAQN
jgi:transposase